MSYRNKAKQSVGPSSKIESLLGLAVAKQNILFQSFSVIFHHSNPSLISNFNSVGIAAGSAYSYWLFVSRKTISRVFLFVKPSL